MKHETRIDIVYSTKTRDARQNPNMPKNRKYRALTKEILKNIDFFKACHILSPQVKYTNLIEVACHLNDCVYFLEKLKTFTTLKKKPEETYYDDHDDHGDHDNHDSNKEPKREYISIVTRRVETCDWCDITVYGNLSKEIQRFFYEKCPR